MEKFNSAGFDSNGFSSSGYDAEGYNRDGFHTKDSMPTASIALVSMSRALIAMVTIAKDSMPMALIVRVRALTKKENQSKIQQELNSQQTAQGKK